MSKLSLFSDSNLKKKLILKFFNESNFLILIFKNNLTQNLGQKNWPWVKYFKIF